jgi:lipid-A-disaccharide synthase-like uncharacterized protein
VVQMQVPLLRGFQGQFLVSLRFFCNFFAGSHLSSEPVVLNLGAATHQEGTSRLLTTS